MRRAFLAALAAVLVAPAPLAQEARFETASVRPYRAADDLMFALQFHEGGRLTATGTLRALIRTAFLLQESQVEGASGWMAEERFDIDGRAGRDATPDEMRVMLRALLKERFGLMLRAEPRDAPVIDLEWAPDVFPLPPFLTSTPNAPAIGRLDSNAPSIFTAVREQLGLTLAPEQGSVEVFVVERAERPDVN